jgi:hypothetical protein
LKDIISGKVKGKSLKQLLNDDWNNLYSRVW